MSTWSSGYVADVAYTYGYYPELNPIRAKLPLLQAGLAVPERFVTACELGFGQGLSTNLHAAASSTQWWGTDFNPSQAGFAQTLSSRGHLNARLFDEAFADFCHRTDLPEFDFIGLHGIWSWISDSNRAVISDFIRRRLRVGGVLYVSYNTMPGWAAFAPMRHLMTEHAEVIGSEGRGIVARINDSLDFADRLLATNPTFARANPLIADRIKKLKEHNRHYLAHEYFNRDWHPMHFAQMASCLEPAKVQFACSAHPTDHIDAANLSPDQQSFLREIPDRMFRESVRDFMVNQQFRRDYWVKGARPLNPLEQVEQIRACEVVLSTPVEAVTLKLNGALGEANLSEEIYRPLIDLLSSHQPVSIGALCDALQPRSLSIAQVLQAVTALTGAGHLHAAQSETCIQSAVDSCRRVNQILAQKARGDNDVGYLANPSTGGGIGVGRFQQIFLQAIGNGESTTDALSRSVWKHLSSQGQKIIKDNKPLESEEENLAELRHLAQDFLTKSWPILQAMRVGCEPTHPPTPAAGASISS